MEWTARALERPRPFASTLPAGITMHFAMSALADQAAARPFSLSLHQPRVKAGDASDIIVWGDSHGDALFPAIAMIGQAHGLSTRQVTKMACPPLLGAERVDVGFLKRDEAKNCEEFNAALLQELEAGSE